LFTMGVVPNNTSDDHVHAFVWCCPRAAHNPACLSFATRRRADFIRLWITGLGPRTLSQDRHPTPEFSLGGLLQRSPRVCGFLFDSVPLNSGLLPNHRVAPTVDLVLLSHGDLAHSGLYAYAYSRWNLKAPTYTTLPVQAMARIAITEDVEGIRDEEDIGDKKDSSENVDSLMEVDRVAEPQSPTKIQRKFVATSQEIHEAFDSVNTLRYSQPTHLQGISIH
jgi:hypothetical protein